LCNGKAQSNQGSNFGAKIFTSARALRGKPESSLWYDCFADLDEKRQALEVLAAAIYVSATERHCYRAPSMNDHDPREISREALDASLAASSREAVRQAAKIQGAAAKEAATIQARATRDAAKAAKFAAWAAVAAAIGAIAQAVIAAMK
jgi:hypothetical protein